MITLNKVVIIGAVGSNPERKTFSNGNSLVKLNVATNESYKMKDDWNTRTDWHQVQVGIPTLADNVEKGIQKGDVVQVEGKIRTESYERDGKTVYFTFIDASFVKRLYRKSNDQNGSKVSNQSKQDANFDEDPF